MPIFVTCIHLTNYTHCTAPSFHVSLTNLVEIVVLQQHAATVRASTWGAHTHTRMYYICGHIAQTAITHLRTMHMQMSAHVLLHWCYPHRFLGDVTCCDEGDSANTGTSHRATQLSRSQLHVLLTPTNTHQSVENSEKKNSTWPKETHVFLPEPWISCRIWQYVWVRMQMVVPGNLGTYDLG